MKLAFYEIFGDPVQDGQITVTREGSANLLVSKDAFLNRGRNAAETCMINDVTYRFSASEGKSNFFEGVIQPNTRKQRLVRFAGIHAEQGGQTSGRIVLLSGTIKRGEAIFDIQRVEEPGLMPGDSLICFTPGSRILTAFGDIPVEHIRAGDLVHTADNGLQPVRWIGKRQLTGSRLHVAPHLRPIKIFRDAFGPGLPAADMWVSPSHRFLLDNMQSSLLFGQEEVLAPANGLVDNDKVIEDHSLNEAMYVHLLFDEHQIVFVEGVPTESFYPCPNSLMSLEEKARTEVFDVLPNLENHPLSYSHAARFALRVEEAKLLRAA